jgi:hypothetical protein
MHKDINQFVTKVPNGVVLLVPCILVGAIASYVCVQMAWMRTNRVPERKKLAGRVRRKFYSGGLLREAFRFFWPRRLNLISLWNDRK